MSDYQQQATENKNEQLDQLYQELNIELQDEYRKIAYCEICRSSKYILHTVVGYDFCTKCQDDKYIVHVPVLANCSHNHTSDCRKNGCSCIDEHYCEN